ncbi:MAG: hypothetical protein Q9173_000237 [Seirophora scorigena]
MRESMDLALSLDKKQSTAHLTQEGLYKSKNVIMQPTSQDSNDQDIGDEPWWEEHKDRIVDLYIHQLYPLKAVARAMESDGLHRTEAQYRRHLRIWRVKKTNKPTRIDWKQHKETVMQLYVRDRKTYKEIVDFMHKKYDVVANASTYQRMLHA